MRRRLGWCVRVLAAGALVLMVCATAGVAQEPPRELDVSPTSAPEGEDFTITVSGGGCVADAGEARVEVYFHASETFALRYPTAVTDTAGTWSNEIHVPAAPIFTLIPGTYAISGTCFVGTGETEQAFDYEEVPFVITAAPAEESPTTTAPPTTTVPVPSAPTPAAQPATPVPVDPTFTG